MKIYSVIMWLLLFASSILFSEIHAQFDIDTTKKEQIYLITTNNDGSFLGKIISIDSREVLIQTNTIGEVYIPKYQINSIEVIEEDRMTENGNYLPNEVFATRYFITTNGLAIEKGENYIQWNWYGPDIQFGVGKNFGVGVMTSWAGVPVIGTMKYSIPLGDKFSCGVGSLIGTASWVSPESGGALPFGVLTFGDRKSNLNISGGYSFLSIEGDYDGRPLFSIAGLAKIGKKVSLVFDSFIAGQGGYIKDMEYDPITGKPYEVLKRRKGGALLIPGVRLEFSSQNTFQFGFGGIIADGEIQPFPIPMVQWYRKI
ncbi:hypothetical protein [Parvicella tangerina]|nr:hypothetical protein [Parvicella tangerina]